MKTLPGTSRAFKALLAASFVHEFVHGLQRGCLAFATGFDEKRSVIINDEKWEELKQNKDMAYFRADLCLYSPESYSLDEKKDICNGMMETSKAMLDAMREDFESMPPELRSKLPDMLCASGVESPQWWWDVLVGDEDPLCRELEPLS